jgi:hypothetical protein
MTALHSNRGKWIVCGFLFLILSLPLLASFLLVKRMPRAIDLPDGFYELGDVRQMDARQVAAVRPTQIISADPADQSVITKPLSDRWTLCDVTDQLTVTKSAAGKDRPTETPCTVIGIEDDNGKKALYVYMMSLRH